MHEPLNQPEPSGSPDRPSTPTYRRGGVDEFVAELSRMGAFGGLFSCTSESPYQSLGSELRAAAKELHAVLRTADLAQHLDLLARSFTLDPSAALASTVSLTHELRTRGFEKQFRDLLQASRNLEPGSEKGPGYSQLATEPRHPAWSLRHELISACGRWMFSEYHAVDPFSLFLALLAPAASEDPSGIPSKDRLTLLEHAGILIRGARSQCSEIISYERGSASYGKDEVSDHELQRTAKGLIALLVPESDLRGLPWSHLTTAVFVLLTQKCEAFPPREVLQLLTERAESLATAHLSGPLLTSAACLSLERFPGTCTTSEQLKGQFDAALQLAVLTLLPLEEEWRKGAPGKGEMRIEHVTRFMKSYFAAEPVSFVGRSWEVSSEVIATLGDAHVSTEDKERAIRASSIIGAFSQLAPDATSRRAAVATVSSLDCSHDVFRMLPEYLKSFHPDRTIAHHQFFRCRHLTDLVRLIESTVELLRDHPGNERRVLASTKLLLELAYRSGLRGARREPLQFMGTIRSYLRHFGPAVMPALFYGYLACDRGISIDALFRRHFRRQFDGPGHRGVFLSTVARWITPLAGCGVYGWNRRLPYLYRVRNWMSGLGLRDSLIEKARQYAQKIHVRLTEVEAGTRRIIHTEEDRVLSAQECGALKSAMRNVPVSLLWGHVGTTGDIDTAHPIPVADFVRWVGDLRAKISVNPLSDPRPLAVRSPFQADASLHALGLYATRYHRKFGSGMIELAFGYDGAPGSVVSTNNALWETMQIDRSLENATLAPGEVALPLFPPLSEPFEISLPPARIPPIETARAEQWQGEIAGVLSAVERGYEMPSGDELRWLRALSLDHYEIPVEVAIPLREARSATQWMTGVAEYHKRCTPEFLKQLIPVLVSVARERVYPEDIDILRDRRVSFAKRIAILSEVVIAVHETWRSIPGISPSIRQLISHAFREDYLNEVVRAFEPEMDESSDAQKVKMTSFLTRGVPMLFMGHCSDTCVARLRDPRKERRNMVFMPFIVPTVPLPLPTFQGGTGIIGTLTANKQRALLVRSFNPREFLLESVPPPVLFELVVDRIAEFARRWRIDLILAPDEVLAGDALSNQRSIVQYVVRRYHEAKRVALYREEAVTFNGQEITKPCVVLRALTRDHASIA